MALAHEDERSGICKTFILGLGHQKCGTTWLYTYLTNQAHFAPGMAKEYHIWDAVDTPELRHRRVGPLQVRFANRSERGRLGLFRAMQRDPERYYDYFASLLTGQKTLTADITPSYSRLGEDRLAHIRDGFAAREVKAKAIILIRNPISRIKSAVRFNLDRGNYKEGIPKGETDFARALEHYYTSGQCEVRTRYNHIITQARAVFDEADLYIGCFEKMFEASEIERISAFLGVEADPSFAKVKVNKTKGAVETTPLDQKIMDFYADVYEFCYANVPDARDLWATKA